MALPRALRAGCLAAIFCTLLLCPGPAFAQYGGGPPGGYSGGYSGRGGFDPGEIIKRMDDNNNGQIDPNEISDRSRGFMEDIARRHNLDLTKPIPADKLRDLMRERFQGGNSSSSNSSSISSSTNSGRSANTAVPVKGFGVEAQASVVLGFGVAAGESWDVLKAKYDGRVIEKIEEALQRNDRNKDGILDAEELKKAELSGNPLDYDKNKDGQLARSELAERYKERYSTGYYDRGRGGPPSGGYGGGPPGGGYGGYGGGPPGGGFGGYGGGPPGGMYGGYGGQPQMVVVSGATQATTTPVTKPTVTVSSAPVAAYKAPTPVPQVVSPAVSAAPTPSPASTPAAANSSNDGALDKYLKFAEAKLKEYDDNKDGTLQRDEWSRMKTDYHKSDRDGNGLITKEELAAHLAGFTRSTPSSIQPNSPPPVSYSTPAAATATASPPPSRGRDSYRGPSNYGPRPTTTSSGGPRKTYRFLSPAERLPAGLPEWFTRNDVNGDGQVAMAEFASSWTDEKAAEFTRWDHNGDGLITAKEAAGGQ